MRKSSQNYIDPVCGMTVDARSAPAELCYNGIQLYFCSHSCRGAFEADPQSYALTQRKGFWRRYLDRLAKSTGGRPPSCH